MANAVGGSAGACVEVARHEGIMLHSICSCWLWAKLDTFWQDKVCAADEVPALQASKHPAGLWAGWVGGIQALCGAGSGSERARGTASR